MAKENEPRKVQIWNLPAEVHDLLRDSAKRNCRSVNQQIIYDLTESANREYALQQADDNKGKV